MWLRVGSCSCIVLDAEMYVRYMRSVLRAQQLSIRLQGQQWVRMVVLDSIFGI